MAKYFDDEGLRYFWQCLKALFANKVDKVEGKGLSTNDFTDRLKDKLDSISAGANQYTHPTYDALTGKPDTNQQPGFGETFSVSQTVTNSLGHVTKLNERTVKIPNTAMTAATQSRAGERGLVPAPQAGDQTKFLRGDGEWATVMTEDKKVEVLLNRTTKAYLLATKETPTTSSKTTTAVADTGVYLDTEAGSLTATSFAGNGTDITNIKADNVSSGTLPPRVMPDATTTTKGAMSAADKTKLDGFEKASNYALKSDITRMYKHKGSVQKETNLPTTGNVEGDVYNVIETNMNYVWIGNAWDPLGEIFKIVSITPSEIDVIMRS